MPTDYSCCKTILVRDISVKPVTQSGGDNLKLAIGAIVFAVLALSLADALIKRISTGFPIWQIFVMRSALAIPVVITMIKLQGQAVSLIPHHIGWTALRSLMLTLMWVTYYTALPHVALSAAAAVYYTLPLFITLFAALLIGEKVGLQGWIAICLGFCGVILVLKPQAADFNAYALLPLISAVLYAFSMILTRTKCRTESPLVLSLALNVSFICVGTIATVVMWLWAPSVMTVETYQFLLGDWTQMGVRQWLVMALLATALIVGSTLSAIAYQSAPSSTVSTFDFSYLAFAAMWGLLFFAEIPDSITIAGIALIAAAGILAVRRKM